MAETVRLDREGGVVLLTIDRPQVKNALDLEAIEAFSRIVDELARDATLRAVVVTGAQGTFISGGDLKDFLSLDDPQAGKRMAQRMQSVLARLEALEVPVIAAIEGVALGGGAEVALACDIRIVSESARIAFKQVSLGIMVGWGGWPAPFEAGRAIESAQAPADGRDPYRRGGARDRAC